MEKKLNDICELKNHLISYAQQNCEMADIHAYGEVIDMIKDLYEVEKDCWKACYYKTLVEAMKSDEGSSERYGYDHWHYANGKFAPTGKGHRVGYIPMDMINMDPMLRDWRVEGSDPPMGYMGEGRTAGKNVRYGYPIDSVRMDNPYDRYLDSRRHYHESKSPEDRKKMEMHAKEHVEDVEETVRDIWEEASPELRKEMKRNLTNLVNGLPA